MYITSIICNILFLLAQQWSYNFEKDQTSLTDSTFSLLKGFDGLVIAIVFINASIGIMTSLFIKTFNSVLKTFVSAIELVLTAILSFIFFGIPIYLNTIVAIIIVFIAILIYAMNPIETKRVPLDCNKDNSKSGITYNETFAKNNLELDKEIDEKA